MFDVGFQELALIGVIALIVVGPERLPRMARTLGLWMGKIRYYVGQVKSDIEREVRAQELKEMLNKPARELDDLYRASPKRRKAPSIRPRACVGGSQGRVRRPAGQRHLDTQRARRGIHLPDRASRTSDRRRTISEPAESPGTRLPRLPRNRPPA